MTTRVYSTATGTNYTQITESNGNATVTSDVELVVDLAVTPDKNAVLAALERLQNYIVQGNYPPV